MIAAIKAFLEGLAALFGFLKDRQLINAGKAEASNENAQATLDTIDTVRAPITDDERERVWARLQAKYGARPDMPSNPGP